MPHIEIWCDSQILTARDFDPAVLNKTDIQGGEDSVCVCLCMCVSACVSVCACGGRYVCVCLRESLCVSLSECVSVFV